MNTTDLLRHLRLAMATVEKQARAGVRDEEAEKLMFERFHALDERLSSGAALPDAWRTWRGLGGNDTPETK